MCDLLSYTAAMSVTYTASTQSSVDISQPIRPGLPVDGSNTKHPHQSTENDDANQTEGQHVHLF